MTTLGPHFLPTLEGVIGKDVIGLGRSMRGEEERRQRSLTSRRKRLKMLLSSSFAGCFSSSKNCRHIKDRGGREGQW